MLKGLPRRLICRFETVEQWISETLAEQWDWRNAAGQLKDMAARTLLLKLHGRKLIRLPDRRRQPAHAFHQAPVGLPSAWGDR